MYPRSLKLQSHTRQPTYFSGSWSADGRDKERKKIFIDDTTLILLQQYISRNRIGHDERIFKVSDATLKRWPQRFADKAGADKFVPCHSLRHHLIAQLIENEWSHDEIQRVTGHRAIASIAH
jgi:site-specific recombinase XerD